jgi:two-component system chemotaxis response regulator CheY
MNKTILIVDDSVSWRQVVKMALVGAGYQVVEAGDGKAALALLDGRTVHMAVCDVNMPVMNGIDFVKAAKTLSNSRFMPIMIPATENQVARMDEGKAAGRGACLDDQTVFTVTVG